MSDLNSIIFEGNTIRKTDNIFYVQGIRTLPHGLRETTTVPCFVSNKHISMPELNQKVRVVGRIFKKNNVLAIWVEHLEIRPVLLQEQSFYDENFDIQEIIC